MKNKILTLLLLGFFCFFTASVFAKKIVELDAQTIQKQQDLIAKVRPLYDKKSFTAIYNMLLPEAKNGTLIGNWFLYVMLGESAYQIHLVQSLSVISNQSVDLNYFYKGLLAYSNNEGVLGAKILSYIQFKDPALYYLMGKMYYSSNHLPEGTAYFSLGVNMKEAPYGEYFYGVSQLGAGNFSRAVDAFKRVMSFTTTDEVSLNTKAQIFLALSYFDNGQYQDAYNTAMKAYDNNKIDVLKTIDPGVILTAMKQNTQAHTFWVNALRTKGLPLNLQKDIQAKLNYNKRLIDPTYPPAWMRKS